ncbi:MAG: DNA-3-methyladenine glycosylase [Myxococcota bacterium]
MVDRADILPRAFYARPAQIVAKESIGKYLVLDDVVLRITEAEAYCGPKDTAAHARFGLTARTKTLFGPVGCAYVYLCYGLHHMLNFVTTGDGSAVLIRSAEPIEGMGTVVRRRGNKRGAALLGGPGKVAQALGLDLEDDGLCLDGSGRLSVLDGDGPRKIWAGPRVGIDYASPKDVRARLRFAAPESDYLSAGIKRR